MTTVFETFAEHPLLLLAVLLALGAAIGHVRVAGVRLGPAAVLFAALGVSAWAAATGVDLEIPEVVGTFGLVLFTYTIGVISGTHFFASLRRRLADDARRGRRPRPGGSGRRRGRPGAQPGAGHRRRRLRRRADQHAGARGGIRPRGGPGGTDDRLLDHLPRWGRRDAGRRGLVTAPSRRRAAPRGDRPRHRARRGRRADDGGPAHPGPRPGDPRLPAQARPRREPDHRARPTPRPSATTTWSPSSVRAPPSTRSPPGWATCRRTTSSRTGTTSTSDGSPSRASRSSGTPSASSTSTRSSGRP